MTEATEVEIRLDVDAFSLRTERSPDNMESNSLPRIARWLQMRSMLLLCGQKGPYILFWPERTLDAYSVGQSHTAGGLALSNVSSNRPD